ncbi:MAG: protein-export chaperone SecB [Pseudohongiellaceae bacterium]
MADNKQETPQGAAVGNPEQANTPNFSLQRIYLKDASFESPAGPAVFQGKWTPKVSFDIKSRSQKMQDEVFEVVLVLTIEAKQDDNVAFLVEVQQAGIFLCRGLNDQQMEQILATLCPNILFPYAREAIDALVIKGSFPPLMLAPVNFDALYAQRQQQQAAKAAGNGSEKPAA